MNFLVSLLALTSFSLVSHPNAVSDDSLLDEVTHGYAQNGDVKIHYVTVGKGPLVVMLHGFPDYWYTWRDQMNALKGDFQVVAVDLRGYNLSDQPAGVENYTMPHLMNDVIAVIKSLGNEKATVVGHDWGGAIAWQLAIHHPEVVERLIVCNMTHPTGYSRASLAALQANGNTSYMDEFRKHTSETMPLNWLYGWVKDEDAREHYREAFARSDVDGMINYYKANTKSREQRAEWLENPVIAETPRINAPVLGIFGIKDKYVSKQGLNDTWEWLNQDFTLVTIPEAGHFVQQDASVLVSNSMKMWLLRDRETETPASALKDLEWMLGTWQREGGQGMQLAEQWIQVSENTYEGRGELIRSGSKKRSRVEDLMITVMGDEIFYLPKVDENTYPIPYKLVAQEQGKLTFENPSHDFPQRIEYELTSEGKLEAWISDMERNKKVRFLFSRVEDSVDDD